VFVVNELIVSVLCRSFAGYILFIFQCVVLKGPEHHWSYDFFSLVNYIVGWSLNSVSVLYIFGRKLEKCRLHL
jgi:hypothetical protein